MAIFKLGTVNHERRRLIQGLVTGAGAALLAGRGTARADADGDNRRQDSPKPAKAWPWSKTVAMDPTDIPPPIRRDHGKHHDIELVAGEAEGKLDGGSTFGFMTWNGKVPGPMIRVRQDDTIKLTVTGDPDNKDVHNIDLHAVYGTGGGAEDTLVAPGQSRTIEFQCCYPGAFIYHCAVPEMDKHISCGMFGMIVVEPHDGLPSVDREFYLGQHEIYTRQGFGESGELDFSDDAMQDERPSHVVFNSVVSGFTADRLGQLEAQAGETVRVFMVSGGPNLSSSFHPIGNVWSRCWPQGALYDNPHHYIQTQPVPPGSCFVGDMELPVAQTIRLVDHALTRVQRKGLLAEIKVKGDEDDAIYRRVETSD